MGDKQESNSKYQELIALGVSSALTWPLVVVAAPPGQRRDAAMTDMDGIGREPQ